MCIYIYVYIHVHIHDHCSGQSSITLPFAHIWRSPLLVVYPNNPNMSGEPSAYMGLSKAMGYPQVTGGFPIPSWRSEQLDDARRYTMAMDKPTSAIVQLQPPLAGKLSMECWIYQLLVLMDISRVNDA